MNKLTIDDVDLKNKKVLVRVDVNVPLDENQNITNDMRIRSSLPTIRKIIEEGGTAILMSHLGRPKGKKDLKFSLAPAAKRLSELLSREVKFANDCIGEETKNMIDSKNLIESNNLGLFINIANVNEMTDKLNYLYDLKSKGQLDNYFNKKFNILQFDRKIININYIEYIQSLL